MSIGRSPRGDEDLHARFGTWLSDGAIGDPPRDVAVHAAHCVRCRAAMMALDHLLVIDPGRAPLPPSRVATPQRPAAFARPRVLAATTAGLVIVASAAWIGAGVLAPAFTGAQPEASAADQRVLGGFGAGGSATPSPLPSLGGVTSESGGETPTMTPTQSEANAVDASAPAPATAQPVPITPLPTVGQSAAPTAAPSRTAAPTATPPPTPTPQGPSPTGSAAPLPECADQIDNDGDGAIDFVGTNPDPECTSALDDDEAA